MIDAIIFDMDGLLIDSEPCWQEARESLALRYGRVWTEADSRAVMGVNTREWSMYMIEKLGLPLSIDDVRTEVVDRLLAIYRRAVPFLPGAEDVVRTCASIRPLAVASGSHPALLDVVLRHPTMQNRFQVVVSADEVPAGKPAPDVYLEAARRLGVTPDRCVCFEDSANGIMSGKRAGMTVIAVPSVPLPPLSQPPDLTIKSLLDFHPDMLRGLG